MPGAGSQLVYENDVRATGHQIQATLEFSTLILADVLKRGDIAMAEMSAVYSIAITCRGEDESAAKHRVVDDGRNCHGLIHTVEAFVSHLRLPRTKTGSRIHDNHLTPDTRTKVRSWLNARSWKSRSYSAIRVSRLG